MRVLVIHNRYAQGGGEDVACEQEVELLRERGHTVELLQRSNRDIHADGWRSQASLFMGTVWSRGSYQATRERISRFRPDVVHLHNFLPLVSPAAYYAAWAEGVPVVQTLHNYRLTCPGATLYRDGRPCEDCVGKATWPGVVHACYRGSRTASLAVATLLETHRMAGTWRKVDAYIAVSDFVRQKLVSSGLPAERVHVKPNFVSDGGVRTPPGAYALYVGRLAPEKGLRTLVAAWEQTDGPASIALPLIIVGSGPLEAELRQQAEATSAPITLLGRRDRIEVLELLRGARMLVCPSEWYEPLAFVAVEALAAGVPLVVSRLGGFRELIDHARTGLHFRAGDASDLAQAVVWLAQDLCANQRIGEAAREEYLARYTPERNYQTLLEIYGRALTRRAQTAA